MVTHRTLILFDFVGEVIGLVADGYGPVEATWSDGTTQHFVNGAELDSLPVRATPVVGTTNGDGRLSLTLLIGVKAMWDAQDVAPIQLATARVFWWPDDEVLRDSHEVFYGVCRDPEWDVVEDGASQVSVSLVPARRYQDVAFPPSSIGDEGRFTTAPDDSKPQAIPVVYGAVRGLPLYAVGITGLLVQLVVAGHRIVSTTIRIMRDGLQITAAAPVLYAIDARGNEYAYVTVTPAQYAAGSNFYAETVTGWKAPDGSAVDRLGDVLIHAFKTYGGASWFELDRPRVEFARPILNRIAVGMFANSRQDGTLMELFQSRFEGQFPVAFSASGGRFGWDATLFPREMDQKAADHIIYGHNVWDHVPPKETSAEDVLSQAEMTYGQDGYQQGNVEALRLDHTNDGNFRRAWTRWGPSPLFMVDAPDCPDDSTAYVLLTDIALKRCRVRTRIEYRGLPARFHKLPPMAIVPVTHADYGWTEEPFLLEAVGPRFDGFVDVVLIRIDGR